MIKHIDKILSLISNTFRRAQATGHRYTVVLAGQADWCNQVAKLAINSGYARQYLWLSENESGIENHCNCEQSFRYLGSEFDTLVFDAHTSFDPDVFGAMTGTIRGGGLLLLLTPTSKAFPNYADPQQERIAIWPYEAEQISTRFLKRCAAILQYDPSVTTIEQDVEPKPNATQTEYPEKSSNPDNALNSQQIYRTADQQHAVEDIINVVNGHRRRPLVLSSDRGRGKSSALGIAAALLINKGIKHIIVTAPRIACVKALFDRAQQLIKKPVISPGCISSGDCKLEFIATDLLSTQQHTCNLLLIDEAAAIPTAILETLLNKYARTVFATTTHGYEGTGRGFAVRFKSILNNTTPNWKQRNLETPIRWSKEDPLENLVFKLLLLNASPCEDILVKDASPINCSFDRLDRDKLYKDQKTLNELFGLLVTAHYQTQPRDLRYMLDGQDLDLYVLRYNGHVAASAFVESEGKINLSLADSIYENRRRIRGHLLPQVLSTFSGIRQAIKVRYQRIIRIAVHPAARRRKLATQLISAIIEQSKLAQCDLLGASFSASEDLLPFWLTSEFSPVNVGITRNNCSGSHSVIMLKSLSSEGEKIFRIARNKFMQTFPHMMSEPYEDIHPNVCLMLMRHSNKHSSLPLNSDERADTHSFAHSLRGYEVNMAPLWRLVSHACTYPDLLSDLTEMEKHVLIYKVLQKHPWSHVASALNLKGKADVIDVMRSAIRKILVNAN